MNPAKYLTGFFGILLVLLLAAIPSQGCPWDLEPAEGDRDMDGLDLVVFAQEGLDAAALASFAVNFGRTDCSVEVGMLASPELYAIRDQTAYYCVQGVIEASIQGGGGSTLVTTGTLIQSPADPNVFSYSAAPNDRLRIIFDDGPEVDYFITTITGDLLSGDALVFLQNAHFLQYKVVVIGELDLEVSSYRVSTGYYSSDSEITVKGIFTYEGGIYTANLLYTGDYYHEGDSSGTETALNESATGNISAVEFAMTVDESMSSITISTSSEAASSSSRTMNNSWTSAGIVYQMLNGRINRAFKDGRPSEVDRDWYAGGVLLRAGIQIGELQLGVDPTLAFIEINLVMSNGHQYLIEKWHTHVAAFYPPPWLAASQWQSSLPTCLP